MQANGVHLHEVEPTGIHYHLLEESAPNDAAEMETLSVVAPPLAPVEERTLDPAQTTRDASYTALLEVLQALEAQAWDVKKRSEVLQDMVEDVAESPTLEPSHQEPLLETAKTLCTDLQDLYRTIRVVLKTQAPAYHTAVWKKSSRSRK
jgi:hypothetical protein